MTRVLRNRMRSASLLLVLVFLSVVVVACGSESGGGAGDSPGSNTGGGSEAGPLVRKIIDTGATYTLEDFKSVGFKKGKTYDVEGLEKAVSAFYGFHGPDPYNRQEYEVRFYESHADAVEYGIPMADEVTGEGAELREEDVTWTEGLKERRQCLGLGTHSHHTHSCNTAKHAAYVVRGNFVLLCQGLETGVSQQHCKDVLDALGIQ